MRVEEGLLSRGAREGGRHTKPVVKPMVVASAGGLRYGAEELNFAQNGINGWQNLREFVIIGVSKEIDCGLMYTAKLMGFA